jgi:hypothetical protein
VEYYIKIGKAYNVYPQVPIPKADALPRPDKLVTDVGASCGQASTEVAATTTDALDSTDAAAHTGDPLPEVVKELATWQWLDCKRHRAPMHNKNHSISDRLPRPTNTRSVDACSLQRKGDQ